MIGVQARYGRGRSGIKDADLMTPLVAEVSVEIHARAESKHGRVGIPVLPPQSVRGVRVFVAGNNKY